MQTQSSNSAKALRKNFTMSDETAKELDFLSVLLRKNRSQIIQELKEIFWIAYCSFIFHIIEV